MARHGAVFEPFAVNRSTHLVGSDRNVARPRSLERSLKKVHGQIGLEYVARANVAKNVVGDEVAFRKFFHEVSFKVLLRGLEGNDALRHGHFLGRDERVESLIVAVRTFNGCLKGIERGNDLLAARTYNLLQF